MLLYVDRVIPDVPTCVCIWISCVRIQCKYTLEWYNAELILQNYDFAVNNDSLYSRVPL